MNHLNFEISPLDNQPKITIFGDSIPKGLYLNDGHIERIEHSAVNLTAQRFNLSINNFSIFGQTLKKCFEKGHFQRWIEERKSENDIPVISLGGNDSDYDWPSVAKDPLSPHLPFTPLHDFENILDKLTRCLKNAGVNPVFTLLPPIDSQRYFNNVISRRADRDKVLEFLQGDITNISRHQECYSFAILKNALENHCDFIDIRTPFLMQTNYLSCLADDGVHPNEKGHAVIAACVIKYIETNYPRLQKTCAC